MSSRILLTSLGTRPYQEVPYEFSSTQTITSRFFSSALAQYLKPDLMLIMLTAEAKNHNNWKNKETGLEAELKKSDIAYKPVDIPTGGDEDELWVIFDTIAQEIPAGSQVYLDVTHAFRTLGIIFLGCLVYLRTTKQVSVEGIYYGAFDPDKGQEPSLVFDLTAFLSLMDWSYAAQAFDKTGDVSLLGERLEERHTQVWRSKRDQHSDLPRNLWSVGKYLREQALALDLIRPEEIMARSAHLMVEIEKAAKDIPEWAKPFTVVLDRISEHAQKFALAAPRKTDINEHIKRQLALCRWYCDHGRFFAASVLQRELLLTWFMHQQGYAGDILGDLENREAATQSLNSVYKVLQKFKQVSVQTNNVDIFTLWHEITNVRNTLAHVGMGRPYDENETASTFIKGIRRIQDKLDKLFGVKSAEEPTGNEAS